jgi:hypothetical protein
MNEPFILEVDYQGQVHEFPAAFQRYGFTYRIAVSIADMPYIFEPDEEGSFRVLNGANQAATLPDVGLLGAISDRLKKL